MSGGDHVDALAILIGLAFYLALLAALGLGFWAIVNPDQLLMMAERVFGITCEDLPDVLCR